MKIKSGFLGKSSYVIPFLFILMMVVALLPVFQLFGLLLLNWLTHIMGFGIGLMGVFRRNHQASHL